MKRTLYGLALLAGLSLVSVANATTVWDFSGTSLQANGFTPSPSGGAGTISAYAFQTDGNGNLLSTPATYWGTPTLNGLFQVNDKIADGGEGAGIAPYNPTEGGTPGNGGDGFPNQDGITDSVPHTWNGNTGGYNSNFLELQLGANIPKGTTLSFLMQLGDAAGPVDSAVNVSWGDGTVGSGGVAPNSLAHVLAGNPVTISGDDNVQPGQFSITTDGKAEVVAIVADCHYLVLDTIQGTSSSVPEPRFYGILLAAMLGIAGIYARSRRRVTE
jgi:hypothetical protein